MLTISSSLTILSHIVKASKSMCVLAIHVFIEQLVLSTASVKDRLIYLLFTESEFTLVQVSLLYTLYRTVQKL